MTTNTKVEPTEKEIIPLEEAIVEEVVEVEQEEEVIPLPPRFSIYPIPSDSAELPKTSYPYYPISKEGLFVYRPLLIGDALVPHKYIPQTLHSIGEEYAKGMFWWTIPPIPAEICASIVSFFKRIYENQKTEAEVLLLLNHKTSEWKVWIPTQQVSYSGVKSVYEPSDLPKGYQLVGSMHSHCDFGAFHSGTDTGDAENFDGIHLTIGKIMNETPDIAAMVMVNKTQFNYKDISIVADFSNLEADTAPEFWDDFVTANSSLVSGHKPQGWELFKKYSPAPPTKAVVPWTPTNPNNWSNNTWPKPPSGNGNNWAQDYEKFNFADDADFWYEYFKDKEEKSKDTLRDGWTIRDDTSETEYVMSLFDEEFWEDGLPGSLVDRIIESKTLQEKDIDHVADNPQDGINVMWWRNLYIAKMADVANILNVLGVDVSYHLKPKKFVPVEEGDK